MEQLVNKRPEDVGEEEEEALAATVGKAARDVEEVAILAVMGDQNDSADHTWCEIEGFTKTWETKNSLGSLLSV
jgi:hypothetical protein